MAKRLPTPEQFATKWNRRIKGATQDVRDGIERVEESPTVAAVRAIPKMKMKILDAIDSGKVEAGLKRVTLEDWKRAALTKGVGRIAAGADEATDKVADFASELLPHIARGQAELEGLPDLTIEDSINRVGTFIRHMAGFKRGARR